MRHLRDTPGALEGRVDLEEAGVPEGVREVTSRRIRRLPSSAREAVEVASVIGREFDFGLLEALGPLTGDDLVAALDEAVRARVLREVDGRVGRYAFAHALVRATLYDGLSGLRRARLHSRVGETILARHQDDLDPWLPQLARHFARAAAVDGPARAIDFALAAGRRADRLLAWEEAADALPRRHARPPGHERSATARRASCCSRSARPRSGPGSSRRARRSPRRPRSRASSATRSCSRARRSASRGRGRRSGARTPRSSTLLEEALRGLGEEDSPLRARLLARLSLELYYAGQPERRMLLSEASVQIARRIGDPATLAAALDARHYVLWRPENVEERLEVAGELRADRRRDSATSSSSSRARAGRSWTCSSSATSTAPTSRSRRPRARRGRAPAALPVVDVAVPLHARAALGRLRRRPSGWRPRRSRSASAATPRTPCTTTRWRCSTSAASRAGSPRSRTRSRSSSRCIPAIPAWRCCQALMHIELGRPDEAREAFESVAAAGFDALPRDANWLIAVTLLAEVCGALGDADRAGELHALLAPHGGRNVLVGRAASCNGSASRLLGILAAVLGQWEEAERRFAEAREMHVRMGARPWLARTELAWAEMLLARGEPGDDVAARERLAEAIVLADALGMVAVAERARALVAGGEPVRSPRLRFRDVRPPAGRMSSPPRPGGSHSWPRPMSSTRHTRAAPECGARLRRVWMGQCPRLRGVEHRLCSRRPRLAALRPGPLRRVRAGGGAPRGRARAARSRSPTSRRRRSRGCAPASGSSTACSAAASCPARSCCSAARPASASRR